MFSSPMLLMVITFLMTNTTSEFVPQSSTVRLSKTCSASIDLHQLYFKFADIFKRREQCHGNVNIFVCLGGECITGCHTFVQTGVQNFVLLARSVAKCTLCCRLSSMEVLSWRWY
jgi:hypothetical protein